MILDIGMPIGGRTNILLKNIIVGNLMRNSYGNRFK